MTTEPQAPTQPRYQPIVRIGRGGMAEVMLAAMQANGVTKLAVLKCLWPELAEDLAFIEMFLDEARLCARLSHPNVVQTYEVLRHGGQLAMAMEYLEGQPLTSVLHRLGAELGISTRLRIVTSILAGLEYAHNLTDFDGAPLHVVHRDVSPHNVFVTYDGHVKLIDFGIAKTMAAQHQTQPGGVKGKMAYLAPEALRGDAIDRRADIFSVGVVLWEILAGRRLWDQRQDGGVPWCLAPDASPPELPADLDVSRELRAVCRRALALDPDARYASAAELGADLERLGALASDSHARHLGQLVARAFAPQRAERRALVEFHLRGTSDPRGGLPDYEAFEILEREPTATGVTIVHGRSPLGALSRTSSPVAAPFVAPFVLPASPIARAPRPRAWAAFAVGAAAALALVSGTHVGSGAGVWPAAKSWLVHARASAFTAAMARVEASEEAPATTTVASAPPPQIQRLAPVVAAETSPPPPHTEHRERRPHHRQPQLDLSDDDVLDIDGSPLPPSRGSGVSRDSND